MLCCTNLSTSQLPGACGTTASPKLGNVVRLIEGREGKRKIGKKPDWSLKVSYVYLQLIWQLTDNVCRSDFDKHCDNLLSS